LCLPLYSSSPSCCTLSLPDALPVEVAALGGEAAQAAGERDVIGSRHRGEGAAGRWRGARQRRAAPGADRERRLTREHRDAVAAGQGAGVEGDVEVPEGALGQLVRLRPHLLQREHVAAAAGQPVAEAAPVRGPDPVEVGGRDAEHARRLRPGQDGSTGICTGMRKYFPKPAATALIRKNTAKPMRIHPPTSTRSVPWVT